MDNDALYEHLARIEATQAVTLEKVAAIQKDVSGNGQPGLKQKVESLESSRDKAAGAIGVIAAASSGISIIGEYLIHKLLK